MSGAPPTESVPRGPDAVVIGTTMLNGGDAALLLAEITTITRAIGPTHVVCCDVQGDVAQRYYPELDVRPALIWPRRSTGQRRRGRVRWAIAAARVVAAARALRSNRRWLAGMLAPGRAALATLETYRQAAVVLTPGGTMLVDQYRFVPRLVDAWAAVTVGCPLVLFTQTLGAFERRSDRAIARRVLPKAALVLVRSEWSRDRAVELGARDSSVHVVADPVFLLNDPASWVASRSGALTVAISVRDWPYFRGSREGAGQAGYEAAIAAACRHLVERHGADITFVSTCQGVPEYAFDDSAVAARIVASLEPGVAARVTVDRAFHQPLALRALLGQFHLAISTRLHAGILALSAGTPVIAIAYEPKTVEVLERLDASQWVLDIEHLTGPSIVEAIDNAVAGLAELRGQLQVAVEAEQRAASDVADLIRRALDDHAAGRL